MADGTSQTDFRSRVLGVGRASGLAAVGVAPASVLEPARSVLHLRKAAGLADRMQFTYRNPDRSTDPRRVLPDATAVIAGALDYRRAEPEKPADLAGRVARYAWRDHYAVLRSALDSMADVLRAEGWQARVHADDNNLVDRNVAFRAGLGWYGKNANLLLPELGSWFVLGGIVTNAPMAPFDQPHDDGCGSCRRCFDGCPTDAIVGPGMIDARRCLAWLVQGPGPIPVEFREAIGDRLYGCDDCQDVCPPNRNLPDEPAAAEPDSDPWIELTFVLRATDEELMERVGCWYIADRDPDVVRRTALVVLGNTADPADPETTALLDRYRHHPSPLLREHEAWARSRLGLAD